MRTLRCILGLPFLVLSSIFFAIGLGTALVAKAIVPDLELPGWLFVLDGGLADEDDEQERE